MNKKELIEALKSSRKRNGRNHPKTYRAIYNLVKKYPYYEGYEQDWISNNYNNFKLI